MTTPSSSRLGPRASRFVLLFVGFAGLLMLPAAVGLGMVLLGPPPFAFNASAFDARWVGRHRLPGQVTVTATRFDTPAAARKALSQPDAALRWSHHQSERDIRRYTLARTSRSGVLLAAGELLLQIEAPDAERVDQALSQLPFVTRNPSPAGRLDAWVSWRTVLFLLAAYVFVAAVGLCRGGAWAAQTLPVPGTAAVPADLLRAQLLAVNALEVPIQVRDTGRGDLVAEWRVADAKWTALLAKGGLKVAHAVKMRFDDRAHVVRNIDVSKKVSWRSGLASFGWSLEWFRGIDFGSVDAAAEYGLVHTPEGWRIGPMYRYAYSVNELKQPLVTAVVSSGWTWQPVVTFFRPLGG
jgi:hypothetical protein